MRRARLLARQEAAWASDDVLLGDCQEAARAVALGATRDDPITFGAKVARLERRLEQLRRRIATLEDKEYRGPFRQLRERQRDRRVARLERRAEALEEKLEDAPQRYSARIAGERIADPNARDRVLHHRRAPTPYPGPWAPQLVTGARSRGPWRDPDARDRALHRRWRR